MQFLKEFKELSKSDAHLAGGKGASLGEMTQAGIPVPPGFVVLADAFEQFLKETNLLAEIDAVLHTVRKEEMSSVEHASERIQGLILNATFPSDLETEIHSAFTSLGAEYVAVRSSATAEDGADHAWAGQLDSYLNTTQATLFKNVQRCWASLFTPRAIFYRFEKKLHTTHISVAVVVQKMVASEVSGIAFSVHPVTEDRNQLIIEAGLGLGEAIVSGSVTPDSYVVEKTPRNILDVNVSTQSRALYKAPGGGNEWKDIPEPQASSQVLTTAQVLELSELILRIESHYGFPCDIEWAYEGAEFYIVQSRPITTLSQTQAPAQVFKKALVRDNNLVIQEVWNEGYAQGLQGLTNPFLPTNIDFITDGVVEIWNNTRAIEWFEENLQKILRENPLAFAEKMKEYLPIADEVKTFRGKDRFNSLKELQEFIRLLRQGTSGFLWFYHAAHDERTPETIREQALAIREKDSFYDDADRLLKASIEHFHPHTKGLSISILEQELESPPSTEELHARFNGSVWYAGQPVRVVNWEAFKSEHPEYFFEEERVDSDLVVKGQTGNPGIVRGQVRILKRKSQINELLPGEVLVSFMTTPDFIPAMRKAAAVVTDEGGITCHAAIFSREIGVPCVIGTKFATQVLKDGDLVEVDADSGVVRIVEHASSDMNTSSDKSLWTIFAGDFNVPFIKNYMLVHALTTCEKRFGVSNPVIGMLSNENTADYIAHLPSLRKTHEDIKRKVDADMGFIDRIIDKTNELGEAFNVWSHAHIHSVDLHAKSAKELIVLLEEFVARQEEMYAHGSLLPMVDFGDFAFVEGNLKEILQKKLPASEYQKYFEILTEPLHNSFAQDQEDALLVLMDRFYGEAGWREDARVQSADTLRASHPAFYSELRAHAEKYGWVYYTYVGPAYTEDNFLEFVKDYLRKDIEPRVSLEHKKARDTEIATLRGQYIENLKPTAFERVILNLVGKLVWAKPRRKDYQSKGYYHLEKLLREIGERLSLSLSQARSLPIETIKSALLTEEKIDPALPDAIYTKHVCIPSEQGTVQILYGKEAEDFCKTQVHTEQRKEVQKTQEIHGTVAVKGKKQGKVAIVNTPADMSKVQDGDILVSRATTPSIILAMKKASAFVTDEGGLTCHAAIVAREMQKPCVVGTKIATQVLKDGDLVEVDADSGVVRILESQSTGIEKYIAITDDWYRSIARPNLMFDASMFLDIYREGVVPGAITDFKYQILLYKNGFSNYYRSRRQIDDLLKTTILDAAKDIQAVQTYAQKGLEAFKLADRCIAGITKIDTFEKLKDFGPKVVEAMRESIQYGTLVPYWIMNAVEKAGYTREQPGPYAHIFNEFDVLRADSRNVNLRELVYENMWLVLAKHFHVENPEIFSSLTYKEFLAVLDTEQLDLELLERRHQGCVAWYPLDSDDLHYSFDQKVYDKIFRLEAKDFSDTELKGAIAQKGVARGRVRILFTNADGANFTDGDVIVSTSTSPNLMPFLRRCGAIVTDEGGIASHAAIVSRELKKPCVIGTKIATQVLKDGDMVEVDADNGVVRILTDGEQKSVFNKSYERDLDLITEGVWAQGLRYFEKHSGVSNPFSPRVIFSATEESLEIWENEQASRWFMDRLLAENKKGDEFLKGVLAEYNTVLHELKQYWSMGASTDTKRLKKYMELIRHAAPLFSLWYYSGLDDRTPESARKLAIETREHDEYFAQNGLFVKGSIEKLGGKRAFANLVLPEEFPDIPSNEELAKRASGIVFIDGIHSEVCSLKAFASKHPEYTFNGLFDEQKEVQEITGQTAQKGVIRGTVRILKNGRQASGVKDGDILVSPMTTPDFLPAMKRAVAFVTDEGGVMCHAAIVAREMKKPCIIGTKFATKVFKDGDLVEVDADNGVVRIVERAGEGELKKNEINSEKHRTLDKLKPVVTREYVPLLSDLFMRGYTTNSYYKDIYFSQGIVRMGYTSGKYYYGDDAWKFGYAVVAELEQQHKTLLDLFENIYTYGDALLTRAKAIGGKKYASSEELFEEVKNFLAEYERFSIALIGVVFQGPVTEKLHNSISKDDEIIATLSFPEKENVAALEQESLYHIGCEIQKANVTKYEELNPSTKEKIVQHINTYGWINARGGFMSAWNPEDIFKRVMSEKGSFEEKLKHVAITKEENKQLSDKLITELALDDEQKKLVAIAKELVFFRTYRTDILNEAIFYVQPLLKQVAEALQISHEDILHCRVDEIFSKHIPSKEILGARAQNYFMLADAPGKILFSENPQQITELRGIYFEELTADGESLKGNTAFKGVVRGKVKRISSKQDLLFVKEGDVLVTAMTTPNMVPAMEKAIAFVTDEGGITCHAAIIAREMKKPCIIGTKFATQVLKDGDLVEVDADKGVVRIIEKAETVPEVALAKIFSRERPFFYFTLWNDSDRLGFKTFLDHNVRNSLFMRDGSSNKGSVWYEPLELQAINEEAARRANADPAWLSGLIDVLDAEWKHIGPLLTREKKMAAIGDFEAYYDHLTKWWSAMTIVYNLSGVDAAQPQVRERALAQRVLVQDYSETMHKIYIEFLEANYPQFADIALVLLPQEIGKVARGELSESDIQEVRARLSGFALFNGKTYSLPELDVVLRESHVTLKSEKAPADTTELKGTTAYKGIVRGRVRVVHLREQVPMVKDGEVLVAEMTFPDFVPAMKRAVAFVTDEGGVMCHAAIVAREMKKPCIISTKFATKVFKDGDLVEVDADNGVVRVLERATISPFVSPELKDFKPEEYRFYGLWKNNFLASSFWQGCYVPELIEELGMKLDGVWTGTLCNGNYICKKSAGEDVKRQIRERIKAKDKAFFKNLISVADREFNSAALVGESLCGQEPSVENFKRFLDKGQRLNWLWLLGATHAVEIAEEMLQEEIINERFPADKAFDLVPPLITPLHHRHKELIELKREMGDISLSDVKKNKDLYHKFELSAAKYPWVEVANFLGESMTADRLYEQVAHIDLSTEHTEKKIPEASAELTWLAQCMHDCGYMKQAGAEYFSIFSERSLPFLNDVAKKIGLTFREMVTLNTDEILAALGGNMARDTLKRLVTRRAQGRSFLFSVEKGRMIAIDDPHDIDILMDAIVPRADKNSKEVRGTVGNRGVYTGQVKVILNTDDFHKMQTGDVLVTTMTTPDFVILMQKSGAIVTNMGGLLCHAAIISRELNKPCVIATKFATQVFKDGDIVEVDADNGRVSIVRT